ncbi:HD domain-containing phosphohydrolase [Mariprofundus ferrooxydans]|uniref:HD domain-containing phosphohydrolase n=1 Tax=Mariprofundus ferrooxydans TaxID=314344 RepID=UPI001430C008|nr:HD domain-containing phosphohydrolase [Mariprofundus ferrooxydans]
MKHIESLLQSLFVMSSMVEARDTYTGGHLWRVAQFSRLLAEEAGLSNREVARISAGGFLHDLGKISIPDAILGKPGPLSDDEYEVIKTHPEVGARLLGGHPLAGLVEQAVLSHHETPLGNGYPHGLSHQQIPLDARIVGICDAFDAMTSTRPYRQGMPIAKALSIIDSELGKQFDRQYGELFLTLGRQGVLDHIVGHSEPGIPVQKCPICGPTIVVTRKHHNGDFLFCRHCGGEAVLDRSGDDIRIRPTGLMGRPAELEPGIDLDLIAELVKECAFHLDGEIG